VYAIIESGGQQFAVKEGEKLNVPTLPVKAGDKLKLDKVLLVADETKSWVGTPYLEGFKIDAEVTQNGKSPKVVVFKKKRRRKYRRTKGHRQGFTEILIGKISAPKKG